MKLLQMALLVAAFPLLVVCFVQAQQTTAQGGMVEDSAFMAARISQLKAQLEAVERETLRRLNCQIKTQVSNSTGCQEIPGLRDYVASMITPPAPTSFTIRQACSVNANNSQWFDLQIPGAAASGAGLNLPGGLGILGELLGLGGSSANRFVYGGGYYAANPAVITREAAPTGALCYGMAFRTRLTWTSPTSFRVQCEDGGDSDFDDLICNVSW